jgi:hypothetical protein
MLDQAPWIATIAVRFWPKRSEDGRLVNEVWRPASDHRAPEEARCSHPLANACQPTIGKWVEEAMPAIKRDKPTLICCFCQADGFVAH